MANLQVFRDRMTCVYTTEKTYNEFLTKKMLGVKVIKLISDSMEDTTHIIDFKEHGIIEAKASFFELDGSRRIYLKLK